MKKRLSYLETAVDERSFFDLLDIRLKFESDSEVGDHGREARGHSLLRSLNMNHFFLSKQEASVDCLGCFD